MEALATVGLSLPTLGSWVAGQTGLGQGVGSGRRRGRCDPAHLCDRGENWKCQLGQRGLTATLRMCLCRLEGSCRCGRAGLGDLPPASSCQARPRPSMSMAWGLFVRLGPGLGVWGPVLSHERWTGGRVQGKEVGGLSGLSKETDMFGHRCLEKVGGLGGRYITQEKKTRAHREASTWC